MVVSLARLLQLSGRYADACWPCSLFFNPFGPCDPTVTLFLSQGGLWKGGHKNGYEGLRKTPALGEGSSQSNKQGRRCGPASGDPPPETSSYRENHYTWADTLWDLSGFPQTEKWGVANFNFSLTPWFS